MSAEIKRRKFLTLTSFGALSVLSNACSYPPATPQPQKPPVSSKEKNDGLEGKPIPVLAQRPVVQVSPSPTAAPQNESNSGRVKGIVTSEVEIKARQVWERRITPSRLGRLSPHDPEPPAFLWNGKQLFVNGPDGAPKELNIRDGKDDWWEWDKKGFCLGIDGEALYLAEYSGLRIYALSAESKFERWKHQIHREALNSAAEFGVYNPEDIKYPHLRNNLVTAFQFERGFLAMGQSLKEQRVGHIVQIIDQNVLLTDSVHIWGSSEWGLFDLLQKKFIWRYMSPPQRLVYGAADQEILAISIPQKVEQGRPWLDGPFVLEVRSALTGDKLWEVSTEFDTGQVVLGRDMLVVGSPGREKPQYWLFNKRSSNLVDKLQSSHIETPFYFFSSGGWFFASSEEFGTKAYFDGTEKWTNKIPGASAIVGTFDSKMVIVKEGRPKYQTAPQVAGEVWFIDARNGQEVFSHLDLHSPISSRLLVGEKLLLAYGNEQRARVELINLRTGARREIDLGLKEPLLHLTLVGPSGVLGQSGNRLLAIRI